MAYTMNGSWICKIAYVYKLLKALKKYQIDDASRFKGRIHNYSALRISIEDDFPFFFLFLHRSTNSFPKTLLLLFIERHRI